VTFFAGKLVLGRETLFERYLHNQTARIERRLQVAGLHTGVLPIRAAVSRAANGRRLASKRKSW
jgi:hypothetical protein